jgi:hypothetical protein
MRKINAYYMLQNSVLVAVTAAIVSLAGCTFVNKATFSIDSPTNRESLLNDVDNYFTALGLHLGRKVDFTYPENRKERSYSLGRKQEPVPLHTTYSYVVLRLEESGILFIDWIRISDSKQVPKPEYFEATHKKMSDDLRERLGIEVKFNFVEAK